MARYNLIPEFENVKSYYNKAQVEIEKNIKKLYSYNVLVCEINTLENTFYLYEDFDFSQTTLRHVKEFLQQHGFKKMTKKEMEAYKNEWGNIRE